MQDKFYITTPIYYANAKAHIGHAYTTVAADVLARFYKSQKRDVFLLTGMDEHGAKIQKAAEAQSKKPQEFVDNISEEFKNLWKDLNIEYDGFIRTTDVNHKKAVQNVLQILFDKGAIYKGEYAGLYCTGCEQFKSENELVDGKCPDHNMEPEMTKEDCYLLKMTEFQAKLIEKIKSDEFEIAPERYKKEILSFLEGQKLEDVSISRKNISWGIPLPFDSEHTTYVWVDAFLNYLTGLGWDPVKSDKSDHGAGGDLNDIPKQWPADVQLIGKDILRVHATIWPIMLLHLGLPLSKKLFVHGHILSGGKKMSKTLGNVIIPKEMIEKFGSDGTRYLLLSAGTFGEDVDVTMERMIEKYNSDLANGLGNLTSRIIRLYQDVELDKNFSDNRIVGYEENMNKLEIDLVLKVIWMDVRKLNQYIDEIKPWELAKSDVEKFGKVMSELTGKLGFIAEINSIFMPETSEKIKKALENKKLDDVLFQRIK